MKFGHVKGEGKFLEILGGTKRGGQFFMGTHLCSCDGLLQCVVMVVSDYRMVVVLGYYDIAPPRQLPPTQIWSFL